MPSKPRRARRAGVVFMSEREESVFDGTASSDHFLTGRFGGYLDKGNRMAEVFEDLSLDEALAWARERTDRIMIRIGEGPPYAIGCESENWLPWPAAGLAAPVRRRVPGEEWKDRTDADSDATWRTTCLLFPPAVADDELDEGRRPEWDAVVAALGAELGVPWTSKGIDGWLADMQAAMRSAQRLGLDEAGWTTYHERTYELHMTIHAPTAPRARDSAATRMPPLPDGWSVDFLVDFVAAPPDADSA